MNNPPSTQNTWLYKIALILSIICLVVTVLLFSIGRAPDTGIPFVLLLLLLSLYVKSTIKLRGSSFTFVVFAFLAAGMYFPVVFTNWFGFNTKKLVVPLIQIIMFGMGTKLSPADFIREFRNPKPLLTGTVLVFTVMPLAGLVIAYVFGFEPEIAVGILLIGSCPGGVASNVMAYLANGNVALSVSLTAFATLISPVVTPALMKLLADRLVYIPYGGMMVSILKMIILPIAAGLVVNRLLGEKKKKLDRLLPLLSMSAIILVVTIIVAHFRDELLAAGLAIIAATIIHNLTGYIFGYWISKLVGLNERDCRTVSIEVGLKNGGMGMGLAVDVLQSAKAALAPIIFGKWMNISGSALANYWRQKKVDESE
ncbi:MAG: bile acid:sodium symporter family protein [Candidatus Latescibacteria bacterium]|nr:bile acid:sodium symporter family protein [Candidatus Latescibacterota bacterium]